MAWPPSLRPRFISLLFTPLLHGGCHADEPPPPVRFVRGGVLVEDNDSSMGEPAGPDHRFLERAWEPGVPFSLDGRSLETPARPACVPIARIPLGNVDQLVAAGGTAPDTALSWSPDGAQLAVGTRNGEILVVNGGTGEVVARRRLSEALVKQVAWSPKGHVLYAGEQSPDANLLALDPEDLSPRWHLSLATRVGSSPLPSGDDLYGVYTLPGVHGLHVLEDGSLLVAAVHAWTPAGEPRRNRSQLLRISAAGQVRAAWPSAGPASVTLTNPRVDRDGRYVAVPVGRSAAGDPPEDLPVNGVQVLSLPDLEPVFSWKARPLEPWFQRVFAWEALDVSSRTGTLLVGLGDGRAFLVPLDGAEPVRLELGKPVLHGEIPLAASVGFGLLHGGTALFQTARTNIPYGSPQAAARPPSTHPGENTLWAFNLQGEPAWAWHGRHNLDGLSRGDDGRTLVVGAGEREADHRRDLFGALLFRLDGSGSGEDRHITTCPTASPVFFRQALSATGLLAVATYPHRDAEGNLAGAYETVIFR